jgi:uncharacterized coiled-coil protein SlyX
MAMDKIDFDILNERMQQLEEHVADQQAVIQNLSDVVRDAQRVIVKIATSQQQIVERVGRWPYVKVREDDTGIDSA